MWRRTQAILVSEASMLSGLTARNGQYSVNGILSVSCLLLVFPPDQIPIDWPRKDWLQMSVGFRPSTFWSVKSLGMDGFEPRQQVKPQEMTKREGNLALAMAVDILAVD
jgi:hypothetical protein